MFSSQPPFLTLGASAVTAFMLVSGSANASLPSFQTANVPDIIIDTNGRETLPNPTVPTASNQRFTCELDNGQYTVMYRPQTQPGLSYPWAVPTQLGGGWTPQRRCQEISQRLEAYRPDGLVELRTAVEGNYNVLCVTTQNDPRCRIVLTVPPGQNPETVRNRVFHNLTVADSGQQTYGINTFVGNGQRGDIVNQLGQILGIGGRPQRSTVSGGINLQPFLDAVDGGTGTQLRQNGGVRNNPSNPARLNPDRFR